jgi:uncharacterized membrane protein
MSATDSSVHHGIPPVRRLELDRPWAWLAAGWDDIRRAPAVSLTYGALFTAISFLITVGVFLAGLEYLLFPLAASFMLVGPLLAVGLYETSRRLETGAPVSLGRALFVATRSPMGLAFLGVALMALLLIWMRAATLLLALFLGPMVFPPLTEVIPTLLLTTQGVALLVVGTGCGAILAALVFAISVVSVPLLMERDVDVVSAVIVSLQAVARNPKPMLLWAWLIAILTAFGIATCYIGLIVTFPLVGHATWHAYRETVGP